MNDILLEVVKRLLLDITHLSDDHYMYSEVTVGENLARVEF